MQYVFRLLEDRLPSSCDPVFLPAAVRVLLVLGGSLTIETPFGSLFVRDDAIWLGADELTYLTETAGATILRWELVSTASGAAHDGRLRSAPKAASLVKLAADVDLDPAFAWLIRCDRVALPKNGEAFLHVHQGPGIRYTVQGEMRIESEGHECRYSAGEAWFEAGIDVPVHARASAEDETAFVRCMLLPRGLRGRSSVRYVRREDDDRPKSQTYRIYGQRLITLP